MPLISPRPNGKDAEGQPQRNEPPHGYGGGPSTHRCDVPVAGDRRPQCTEIRAYQQLGGSGA